MLLPLSIALGSLLLNSGVRRQEDAFDLSPLAGRWALSLEFADNTIFGIAEYKRQRDGSLINNSTVRSFLGDPAQVVGRMGIDPKTGQARFNTVIGKDQIEQGTIVSEGSKFVFIHQEGGKVLYTETLEPKSKDHWAGVVAVPNGKEIAKVTLRRIMPGEPVIALRGLDPIAFARGQEVSGKESVFFDHGHWRYLFADGGSRNQFKRDLAKNALQYDGACMNMGPLSGRGTIFGAREGKLYAFASVDCQKAFEQKPEGFEDRPKPAFKGQRGGRELLDKAAKAHGVDVLKTLQWAFKQDLESDGVKKPSFQGWSFTTKGEYESSEGWQSSLFRSAVGPDGAWSGRLDQPYPLLKDEADVLVRQFMRHPIYVLAMRKTRGFVSRPAGENAVECWYRGASTKLTFGADNRVTRAEFRVRPRTGSGEAVRIFDAWSTVDGVIVPTAWTTTVDGRASSVRDLTVSVNKRADTALFRSPLKH